MSSEECLSVGFNENDGTLEIFRENFRKSIRSFLIGRVIDFARGNFAPAFNPALAKMTFAVPNQQRLGRRIGDAKMRVVSHGLDAEFRPDGRMIGRLSAFPHFAIDASISAFLGE